MEFTRLNEKHIDDNLCFFDTETTGLHAGKDRLLSLAFIVTNSKGVTLEEYHALVKPHGFRINEKSKAFMVNGISNEKANTEGFELKVVLRMFIDALVKYKPILIAHNFGFDKSFVANELTVLNWQIELARFEGMKNFCTANGCKGIVLGLSERRRPRLIELYRHLHGKEFENQHDALEDVKALLSCYFKLKRLGYSLTE